MKRWFVVSWTKTLGVLLLLGVVAARGRADGLIIVHDPFSPPWPLPPPQPVPPFPRPIPLPRPYAFAPLEVNYHRVRARIRDQVASTTVEEEFYNPNDRQLEGTYVFPIPTGAQIDKFSMEVNGKPVRAELLSADKARQLYEDLVRKLRDPALLEYAGRDAFRVRIFPIEPQSKKRVTLAYTQLLKAEAGLISYLYPLNTEKFSAKPIQTVRLEVELTTTRPLKSIYSPTHPVEIRRDGDRGATVSFESKDVKPDTDFELYFAPEKGDVGLSLLTQRRPGEDGYFLLLATPAVETQTAKNLPKDVAFVLDTSGSMAGAKLAQAKKALLFCIASLNPGDRFELIRFSTETEPLFHALVEASQPNRERAAAFVNDLQAAGGTALQDALTNALAERPAQSHRPYLLIFLTDGQPTVGETEPDRIVASVRRPGAEATRIFCFGLGHDVNTHLLDQITEATRASSQYVLPEEDLEVKVSNFFTQVKEPALTDPTLVFPEAVRVTRLYPAPLPDLFRGAQVVAVGRYAGQGDGPITLQGTVNGARQRFSYPAHFPAEAQGHEFIPRLWATRRIGYLLDLIRLHGENVELREEVTSLARQYGIVTPYTAYLIHEDEARRGVPLAQQSVPGLGRNEASLQLAKEAYLALRKDVSGPAAVAAARYGRSQMAADQVGQALIAGRSEARLALNAVAATPTGGGLGAGGLLQGSVVPAGQVSALPAGVTAGPTSGLGVPVGAAVTEVVELTQQSRFVNGRTFFFNSDRWIDSRVQTLPRAKRVRLQFNSADYFNLIATQPVVRPWLALGPRVQFVLRDVVYEVAE